MLAPALKNLSVSKMEKYLQCPLAFKYQYVDKIPQLSSWTPLGGRVVHALIEAALREYAKTERYPDWKTMDDRYLAAWDDEVKEEEGRDYFLGWRDDPKDPMEKVKVECRPLVRIAREGALEQIRPWMIGNDPVVEYRIDLELPSEIGPFKLVGFIDLLDASGILTDWKTTKNEVSGRAKKGWLQFGAYALHVWPLVGEEIVRCRKIFLIRGEDPRVEFCDYAITPKHRAWFVDLAAKIWKLLAEEKYHGNPTGWWCSDDTCSFWPPCQGELATVE